MTSPLQKLADELADLYARLHVALTPFAGVSNSGRPSGKPGSRPPVNLDASDLITEIDRLAADLTNVLVTSAGRPYRIGQPTVTRLRRLPMHVEALPASDDPILQALPDRVTHQLTNARTDASTVLGLGPRRIYLAEVCPECRSTDRFGRGSLVADPEEGAVWCRNRDCWYECGRPGCWCQPVVPLLPRGHRYRWGRTDLLRFADLLAAEANLQAERQQHSEQLDQARADGLVP